MREMRYLSVCSGIEAATVAWHPLGWTPVAFAEIDPFASAVLAHRIPHVPNLGDFTEIQASDVGAVDVMVGGTPCQSFSVAGLRGGLGDDRGNLALEFCRLADRLRPRWIVWENVPGVLSSNGGRDFGAILGALGELGYGWAYRVLDAQYFGVPQRRRRVFLVGHLGNWLLAAAVLFERQSLQRHSPPRRETREGLAHSITARAGNSSRPAGGNGNLIPAVCPTLRAGGNSTGGDRPPGTDVDTVESLIPIAFGGNNTAGALEVATAVRAKGGSGHMDFESETFLVEKPAFPWPPDVADPISASEGDTYTHEGRNNFRLHNVVPASMRVRRLTPRECERLQGFPDDWTLVPYRGRPAPDGPRYRAIGNSFPVPVIRWIGERISLVERVTG